MIACVASTPAALDDDTCAWSRSSTMTDVTPSIARTPSSASSSIP